MLKFLVGSKVRLLFDIVNDGTMHGFKRGENLQWQGDIGYVRKIGMFLDQYVYDVHFTNSERIVGCREKEIIDGDLLWNPPKFRKHQSIYAVHSLGSQGKCLVAKNTRGVVQAVMYREPWGYVYEVSFDQTQSPKYLLKSTQIEAIHSSTGVNNVN